MPRITNCCGEISIVGHVPRKIIEKVCGERKMDKLNKLPIDCESCKKHKSECNAAMDYPICLSEGECQYYGKILDEFCYSLFEPKEELIQLFPRKEKK